jgi:hypothetical protein
VTALLVLCWLVCGVVAYASTFAHFQREFPQLAATDYRRDMAFSVFVGITGPVGLFVALSRSGCFKHGLKFK